jgi:hypothetical protein
MTRYQLQICLSDGRWIPAPEPNTFRSMTAATIAGLKAFAARDIRVISIRDPEWSASAEVLRTMIDSESKHAPTVTWDEYRERAAKLGFRTIEIDGQPVLATTNVTDERIRDEIARRRERENQNENENGEEQENG